MSSLHLHILPLVNFPFSACTAKYENYHIGDSARSNRSSLRLPRILTARQFLTRFGQSDHPN
jgi:hypothetical protein